MTENKQTKVTITTATHGVNFGVAGYVSSADTDETIHETRLYPYGMDNQAYTAARDWATEHGYRIVEK